MKSMIAWFARNGVAANLLMALILILGTFTLFQKIPTEVFPDFDLDIINVSVPYRGATPAEVEESVIIRIEEAIQDLEGIKQMNSTAAEGAGNVSVEIDKGYNARELLDDIKNRIDAINTFPEETENPIVALAQINSEVITVVLSGALNEQDLRLLGEQIRDEIANLPTITQVALNGVRPYEISIELPESTLQRYGLSLAAVSRAINNSSLDLPAGAIKTEGGDVLLRTKGQAYTREDFEKIVLISRPDGTRITVGDIASVRDGFEETPLRARWNGNPCVLIVVSRVGDQNAIELAEIVKGYMNEVQHRLPPGIELSYWNDRSRIVLGRISTLTSSALLGFILVVLTLTLFLRLSLALWVSIGIPVAFMGAIALMPLTGVTINIFSLFAFILVLGIVVDDAIVTGENVFSHLQRGDDPLQAAINGTQEVAVPVTFGVLTTVVAFLPLAMLDGTWGKIFIQIPLITIPVLIFSLVESKFILPAHLKHLHAGKRDRSTLNPLARFQRRFADGLMSFVKKVYQPILERACHRRYLTLSIFLAALVILVGLIAGGRIRFMPFPRVQSETARARLTMPQGTPIEQTTKNIDRMIAAAEKLQAKYVDPESNQSVIQNILSAVGTQRLTGGGPGNRGGTGGAQSHLGEVSFRIIPPEERTLEVTSQEIVNEWRRTIGPMPGAQEVTFRASIMTGGSPIDVQLTGASFEQLAAAADKVKEQLQLYPGIFDISDSFEDGKQEIQLSIKPEAELLGLTMADLARQTRQAFFGLEAQRIQRGREDVRVMVRYPESERRSLANLESMRIRTADGTEVPFSNVAEARMGRSFSTIQRIDRNRTVNVKADANKEETDLTAIRADLMEQLPAIVSQFPGVDFTLEGEAKDARDTYSGFVFGSALVLFSIYALLAIPFRSYLQPFIVMSVIPFGLVGAALGHLILGMSLSMMSLFGMLALTGVVVNDSLVLVDYVNRRRAEGLGVIESVRIAGGARFRPIFLTSITTFAGILPVLFEKSTQAQFVIPMAVSLGFGILLATAITLFLVPINYLILEDVRTAARRYWAWQTGK